MTGPGGKSLPRLVPEPDAKIYLIFLTGSCTPAPKPRVYPTSITPAAPQLLSFLLVFMLDVFSRACTLSASAYVLTQSQGLSVGRPSTVAGDARGFLPRL